MLKRKNKGLQIRLATIIVEPLESLDFETQQVKKKSFISLLPSFL